MGDSVKESDLAAFIHVYKTGRMSVAAQQIPMSFQGLSRIIRLLEAEVGAPLFYNDHGKKIPTKYGDELYSYATRVNAEHRSFVEKMAQLIVDEDIVRVVASDNIFSLFGADFISAFRAENPSITITLTTTDDYACDQSIANGTFDLGLTLAPFDSSLTTERLYSTPLVFWVNERNRELFEKDMLAPEDLEGQALVLGNGNDKIPQLVSHVTEEHDVTPKCIYPLNDSVQIYRAVAHGTSLAATILPVVRVFRKLPAKPIPFMDVKWEIGVSHLPDRTFSKSEKAFVGYCELYTRRIARSDPLHQHPAL